MNYEAKLLPFNSGWTLQQTLNSFAQTPQVVSSTVPKAEVFETGDQVAIKIEVPGLSEKDFEITLHNSVR